MQGAKNHSLEKIELLEFFRGKKEEAGRFSRKE